MYRLFLRGWLVRGCRPLLAYCKCVRIWLKAVFLRVYTAASQVWQWQVGLKPRSNQLWGAPALPRSSVRRMGRSADPANRQSWPGTVACPYFRAQNRDDRSEYNVRQAPVAWSPHGMSVPCISVTFDGYDYGFVAARPSLRCANTDFPLQNTLHYPRIGRSGQAKRQRRNRVLSLRQHGNVGVGSSHAGEEAHAKARRAKARSMWTGTCGLIHVY
jgi:hypothetical protein